MPNIVGPRPGSAIYNRIKFDAITELCQNLQVQGGVIEVGVWKGGMAVHLVEIMPDRKIYLADTYTGIPYFGEEDNYYKPGQFADVSAEEIRKLFSEFDNVIVLQGIFPDAFREILDKETFAVIHMDCDMYKSYKDGLEFLYPRTAKGGIVFLDDYKAAYCSGATKACDEFMANCPEKITELKGQYYFIKE